MGLGNLVHVQLLGFVNGDGLPASKKCEEPHTSSVFA